jgi:hypothetical protein
VKNRRGPNIQPTQLATLATLATLASGAYLKAGEPVVLPGDSGTGTTHLLIGLGANILETQMSTERSTWLPSRDPEPCPGAPNGRLLDCDRFGRS